MANWDYGGAWLRHDMTGEIELPNNSRVMVHDLITGLPEFMKQADTLFIDPPCSTGNLRSFHTKAGQALPYTFDAFEVALFQRISEIAPRHLFLEVFKSNRDAFYQQAAGLLENVRVYQSFYYNKPSNQCWIIHASNDALPEYPLNGMDEAKIIAWVCANHQYQCIGDLCIGRGLVGKHAFINGKRFVGTELNKKRLAVLVDFCRISHVGCVSASVTHHPMPRMVRYGAKRSA